MQVVLGLDPGGTERLVIDIVTRLRSRFPMSVCCLDRRGTWAAQLDAIGVPVDECARRPGFHPSLGGRIAALARRANAAVLHCHHYTPFVYGAIAAWWRPRGNRPAVIFTEHGRLSDQRPSLKRRMANQWLARVPAGVYAVSDDLARHLRQEGFPERAVRIVRNGIDPGPDPDSGQRAIARTILGLDDDDVVIATVGRADPVKDLGTLVRAFAGFADVVRSSRLVVIGDGAERLGLEALAATLHLRDRVHFTGLRTDARSLIAAADVYVNSSITEGVSLTILEAMAAGVPVVATRVGGTPEVVADGASGLLVPPGDPAAMTGAILSLVRDPAFARRLAAAARARVLEHFNLDTMIGAYADAYERAGAV